MAQASRDENFVPTALGVLNTTGASTVKIGASPTTHGLAVLDGTGQTDHGPSPARALRADNGVTCLMATDSTGALIPIYADSTGKLLFEDTI